MLFPPFPSIACLSSSSSATLACFAREAAAVVCHACKCYPSSSMIVKWGFFVQVYLLAGQLSKEEYHFSCVQFKCRELLTRTHYSTLSSLQICRLFLCRLAFNAAAGDRRFCAARNKWICQMQNKQRIDDVAAGSEEHGRGRTCALCHSCIMEHF